MIITQQSRFARSVPLAIFAIMKKKTRKYVSRLLKTQNKNRWASELYQKVHLRNALRNEKIVGVIFATALTASYMDAVWT